MAAINTHNYEAYLLDFSEGNLSVSLSEELRQFVSLHPELEINLSDMSLPKLAETTVNASFKDSLKRQHLDFSDEDLIDYLEGNLNLQQKRQIETKLKTDSDFLKSFNIFQHTFLQVDHSIVFSEKNNMLKTEDQFLLNNPVLNYLEGHFTLDEKVLFEAQLTADAKLKKELDAFRFTVLVADKDLVFEEKLTLKKEPKFFVLFQSRVISSLVAAALLVVGSVYVFDQFYKVESTESISIKNLLHASQAETTTSDGNKEPDSQNLSAKVNSLPEPATILKNKVDKDTKSKPIEMETKLEKIPEHVTEALAAYSGTQSAESSHLNETNQVPSQELNELTKQEITQSIQSELTHFSSLEELSEDGEDNSEEVAPTKHPFWRRAVQLAKQVNNLGLKAVNGSAKENDQYLLSFNSFSIEKK